MCVGTTNYVSILCGQPISVLVLRHLYWSVFINKGLLLWLRLLGRRLLFKFIFGGVTIVLANKSITTHGFTLLSLSVMISSLNDYWKPLLNRVGNLSLSILLHAPWDDWLHSIALPSRFFHLSVVGGKKDLVT